ncbi:hypothetical protein ACKKBG_A04680 [Auxenochlorella protothecoides x Auxenochlorella symbiontica]
MRAGVRWASLPLWATSVAAAYRILPPEPAHCSASPQNHSVDPGCSKLDEHVGAFKAWLQQAGGEVSGVEFRPAHQEASGMAVYANASLGARQGWGQWAAQKLRLPFAPQPVSLAAFPLSLALTGQSVAARSPCLAAGMDSGAVDERDAVILYLAAQRRLGPASQLHPWLRLLPKTFTTTLFWKDEEVEWLAGTTLHRATLLRRMRLQESWKALTGLASRLAAEAGAPFPPTESDFLWAHAVFWSRAIAFPCPPEALPGGRSTTAGPSPQEGVVPGLDFCNHAMRPVARWTVYGAELDGAGGGRRHVHLVPSVAPPAPGAELCISYGDDKSNEELLFLYGFALPEASGLARLMLPLPLPAAAEDWTPRLHARVALLAARVLPPQVFLPRAALAGGGPGPLGAVPDAALRTLEVFVLDDAELARGLEAAERGDGAAGAEGALGAEGPEACAATRARLERDPGLRLALTGALVGLLQLMVQGLETGDGCQTLEADAALSSIPTLMAGLSANQRAALMYRMEQKSLARDWLAHAKSLRAMAMEELRAQGAE